MLGLGPKRTILKRRIIPFFVETFCDGNHPDHNRPCAMRVLHEIDYPHHRVAVRFSREEFYYVIIIVLGAWILFKGRCGF